MPLNCDCFGGCWGVHSKDWPKIDVDPGHYDRARSILVNSKQIPYGSYVTSDYEFRFETEEFKEIFRETYERMLYSSTHKPPTNVIKIGRKT